MRLMMRLNSGHESCSLLTILMIDDAAKRLLETMPLGIVCFDDDGVSNFVNQRAREWLKIGDLIDPPIRLHDPRFEYIRGTAEPAPNDQCVGQLAITSKQVTRDHIMGVRLVAAPEGATRWFIIDSRPLTDGGVMMAFQDVTTHIESENRLQKANEQLERLAVVFREAQEGILIAAPDGAIVEVNRAFERMSGYRRNELIGKNPRILQSGRQDASFYRNMWRILRRDGAWSGETWNRRKDGSLYLQHISISAIYGTNRTPRHYIALCADVTREREQAYALRRMQHYDPLTDLPNQVILDDRLRQAISQARRFQTGFVLAQVDLDGFRQINDAQGHHAGDELLRSVAARLRNAVINGDTVARVGGDEFVVLMLDIPDSRGAQSKLATVARVFNDSFTVGSKAITSSATIVAQYISAEILDGATAENLLRQTTAGLPDAKASAPGQITWLDPTRDRAQRARNERIERLSQAIRNNELRLFYQPKVHLGDSSVIGFEALVRWQHPDLGLLGPGEFLPDLENNPVDLELGEWVLRTALTEASRWKDAGLQLDIGVNISPMQLLAPTTFDQVLAALRENPNIKPAQLELEIIETTAFDNISSSIQQMKRIAKLGVRFAIDDFGTGYSSLTYLRRLPADTLKIDRSFIRDMLIDSDDHAIIVAVLQLAKTFHRRVVAEGVEDREQFAKLKALGCDEAQGFGIAPPMPAEEVIPWIRTWDALHHRARRIDRIDSTHAATATSHEHDLGPVD
ncbi:MAG: EAL domain-containing protein [Thioalkalivibrionaceae bacterium]